jgi:hypothetical protein
LALEVKTALEIRQLICEISLANPLWGAPRIHGELLKLVFDLGQTTVAKYMARGRRPPSQAGLSHVQEHIDEENVVPGSAFELASQGGLCIGMSTSNIEGKSPQNGEVGGSMVFSASPSDPRRERRRASSARRFRCPMFANDAQQFCGRVALGQKEVALDGLVASTFAGDPSDGLETWKVVLFGHVLDGSNDRGSGFFAPVIGVLGGGFLRSAAGLAALASRSKPGWLFFTAKT